MDLAKKAFVTGVGIDRDGKQLKLTLQIVKPSVVAPQDGGGTAGDEPVWVNTSTGETLFEAIRNQLVTVARKPDYSHVQVIVIGESLAREGIADVLDFFERDQEPRLTARVLIARDISAEKVMGLKSELEKVPAMHLIEVLENAKAQASIVNKDIFKTIKALQDPGVNPVLGVLHPRNNQETSKIKDMSVSGAALFCQGKLVGWLSPKETVGLNYLLGEAANTVINVKHPSRTGKYVAIEQMRSSRQVELAMVGGKPHIFIRIKGEGNIGDQQGGGDLTQQADLSKLEREVEAKIKSLCLLALNSTQRKYKVDALGFAQKVHKQYPEYWHREGKNWSKTYRNIPIKVEVDFRIRMTGFIGPSM